MTQPVLKSRYEEVCADQTSDIWEHLPTFVDAVAELDATTVVELGVRYGVSTIAWLHALDLLSEQDEERHRHLWSVDCSFPVAAPGTDVNLLDTQGPLGVQRGWTFILGYDHWHEVLDALPDRDIDVLFIDTNHVYEETLVELELYLPRMSPGGRIFLHDTAVEVTGNAVTPQPPFPVRTAMQEFCDDRDLRYENNPNCFGLGTIFVEGTR